MTKLMWKTPLTLSEINARAKNTLSDHLKIEFIEIGDRHLTARMPISSILMQPMGIVHGGATAALAETVASAAANYCIDQAVHICVGLELNINHLRSIQAGYVDAVATPLHIGKTTQVWEIKIYDELKHLTSAARLTLAVIAKK